MSSKFPVGAWICIPFEKATENDIKLWKECGLTLTMSPSYDPDKDDKQKMLEFLDKCAENDIKLIMWDKRAFWLNAAADPEGYRERFRGAYADFGHHSAVYGFYIGDEPRDAQTADMLTAFRIQCEEAPSLVPFVNFLPLYQPEVREWVDKVFSGFSPKIMCYDRYSQLVPDDSGTEDYFSDLRDYRQIADEKGIPLWTTVCSVGHMRYQTPTEDDIRWQFNTALACGCNGVLWFLFYNPRHHVNYRKAPINIFGERTQTYYALSDVLREFHEMYGDTFTHLTLKKSYHVGRAWGGYPHFRDGDSDIILRAKTVNEVDIILSFFKDENGTDYLAVVCNSKTEAGEASLVVSKAAGKMIRVGALEMQEVYSSHLDEGFEDGEDTFTYKPWLAPGQMNLYRFDK